MPARSRPHAGKPSDEGKRGSLNTTTRTPRRTRSRAAGRAATVLTVATAVASLMASEASAAPPDVTADLVGGHKATGDTSWMAAVLFNAPAYGARAEFNCGGTLVFPNVVVSAGHCFTDMPAEIKAAMAATDRPTYFGLSATAASIPTAAKQFYVNVGSKDRRGGGEYAKVIKIIVHPGWNWKRTDPTNDIVKLILDRDVDAQPLPVATHTPDDGTPATLYGWGRTRPDGRGALPTQLQQLETTVLDPSACADAGITEGENCTDNPNGTDGPNYGDSGGPEVVVENGVERFAGVCSRGSAGPGKSKTAYSDAASFRTFIYDAA